MAQETKVDDITEALRQRILSGEFGTGGRLPSLRMFAEQFGTTHETMNKVVQRLQAEGLLSSLGRAGVFVRASQTRVPGRTSQFDLYLKQLGLEPIEAVIDVPATIPAPLDAVQALNVSEGTLVVYRSLRQGTSTAHYRLVEDFFPTELVDGSMLELMQKDERYDVLLGIKQRHGKIVQRIHEDVIGRLPTQHEQDVLKIVRGTPVLEVNSIYYADDKTALLYRRLVLVANYFVLSYDYAPLQKDSFDEKVEELVRVAPSSVVLWVMAQVEREISEALTRLGLADVSRPDKNVTVLLQKNYIARDAMNLWKQLSDVRNRVAHMGEEVTEVEALNYASTARRLIQKFASLSKEDER